MLKKTNFQSIHEASDYLVNQELFSLIDNTIGEVCCDYFPLDDIDIEYSIDDLIGKHIIPVYNIQHEIYNLTRFSVRTEFDLNFDK